MPEPSIGVVPLGGLESESPAGHTHVAARFIVRAPGAVVFQECVMGPGGSADSHAHEDDDQLFLVLEGRMEVTGGDGRTVTAGANEAVVIPARCPHAAVNPGEVACRYLVLTYPSPRA